MRTYLRSLGGALTLAGAVVAIVLFVVPAVALGGGGGDKQKVSYYLDEEGNRITKVGENQKFNIVGAGFGKAVEVFCYAGKDDNDTEADSPKGWDDVNSWTFANGKLLVDVFPDLDCAGHKGPVIVEFEDGSYVKGPTLLVRETK